MAGRLSYLDFLRQELKRPRKTGVDGPLVYDLFAGCGGLGLGFEAAGFRTVGFEMLPDACATYRANLRTECHEVKLHPGTDLGEAPEVIVGGPPCQPFSVNGHQHGRKDERDGFPAYLSAIERYRPKVAIFENVRGMLYRNHAYLEHIIEQLESLGYVVEAPHVLNAVRFGVPQNRQRLFIVAHQGHWSWPEPVTAVRPYTAGDALGDLASEWDESSKFLTASMDAYVLRYENTSKCIRPRDLHLDIPSRTVTCRNLNGATGDMLRVRLADNRRRRLTPREGARLQSFPDWFKFTGNDGSQFNQIGNAVPPLLAKAIATSVMRSLLAGSLSPQAKLKLKPRGQTMLFA